MDICASSRLKTSTVRAHDYVTSDGDAEDDTGTTLHDDVFNPSEPSILWSELSRIKGVHCGNITDGEDPHSATSLPEYVLTGRDTTRESEDCSMPEYSAFTFLNEVPAQ